AAFKVFRRLGINMSIVDATAKNQLFIPVEETLVSDYLEHRYTEETKVSSTVVNGERYIMNGI
ncbi:MAG TPA: hypothetical protein PKI17_03425, partial [Syntrophomonas sp.]|nr:hypothetical protein [Syntrophomonas sp.]